MGVNATGSKLWLAVADNGVLVPADPFTLEVPAGLQSGVALVAFLEDCQRTLAKLSPTRVVVLNPESNAQTTFLKARDRATGEAFISLASAVADVPCEYLSRQKLRSLLGLPRSGSLVDLANSVIAEPMKPYWKNARDLASLAALAAHRPEGV